ncbi:MAG: DUF1778 domain-containing protein [Rhodospirillales bacterium]
MTSAGPTANRRTGRPRNDTSISLRIASQTRELIDQAASLVGKSRTEFVIDSAREHAIDVLLDQRLFRFDEKQFAAFTQVLDNPPAPNEKLRRLFAAKSPWEK